MTKCPRWLASKRLDSRLIQEERRNEDIFLLAFAGEATPPGLSRENSRPPASGARTALRVRRPNQEPVRRQFPPGPMPASGKPGGLHERERAPHISFGRTASERFDVPQFGACSHRDARVPSRTGERIRAAHAA